MNSDMDLTSYAKYISGPIRPSKRPVRVFVIGGGVEFLTRLDEVAVGIAPDPFEWVHPWWRFVERSSTLVEEVKALCTADVVVVIQRNVADFLLGAAVARGLPVFDVGARKLFIVGYEKYHHFDWEKSQFGRNEEDSESIAAATATVHEAVAHIWEG